MQNEKQPDLDLSALGAALREERAALLDVSRSSAQARQPVELDQQSVGRLSRMDAMQAQAMAQAVEVRRRARLAQISAALERLESRDFGACLKCGDDIAVKRLRLDPAASLCVDCAGQGT